jgi:hypothetical protein
MKARLIINEIRRMGSDNALSSLGVGKVVELRALKWFNENLPFVIRDAQTMDVALGDEKFSDLMKIIKKRLGINAADYKWIDYYRDSYNSAIDHKIRMFTRDISDMDTFFAVNTPPRFESTWAYGTLCKFSKTYEIGSITIQHHDTIGRFNGWFVKYR